MTWIRRDVPRRHPSVPPPVRPAPHEAAIATQDEGFSYAAESDPGLKRLVIRAIERLTGQPRLKRLYDERHVDARPGESFWDTAVRLLGLDIAFDESRLARIPRTDPLVIVANHPFGVLDGIVICWLVGRVRRDFRVLTNSVLLRAEEAREHLLPVDFAETREALERNIRMRAEALAHLRQGGCVIVFPAGGISTAERPFGMALDAEWKPFTARLIQASRAHVTPVFFEGQNSRLFQWASRVSLTLRLSLIFREVCARIGDRISVHVGETIPPEELADIRDRSELMAHLRERTYALAPRRPRRRGLRNRIRERRLRTRPDVA